MPKFSVKRSVTIAAPVEKVYASVRDFRNWPEWSPWLIAEPDCTVTYAEDGSSYSWDGKIVGAGEMAIDEEVPSHGISYKLTFLKPWKSKADVQFQFEPDGSTTVATWTMDSSLPFIMFWMKKMMVAMIGMDYERGLKMLKGTLEHGSNPSHLEFLGKQTTPGCQYVGITNECSLAEIGDQMSADFKKIKAWAGGHKELCCGAPFSITHKFDMVGGHVRYTSCFPVSEVPASLPDGFVSGSRPDCSTYAIKHTGPYEYLSNAWSAGMMHARSKVFAQNKRIDCFETYENDPDETPESDLITIIHLPAK